MTDQEKINSDVQIKLAMQDAKFNVFIQEMRDRDNQRADDIRELRQDMKDLQKDFYTKMDNMDKKLDKKIDKLEAKIENIGNHVRNVSVATIIGVATITITVIYSILSR